MSIERKLAQLRDAIQTDPGKRGLAPELFGAFADDFALACRSLAEHPKADLAVVTGFYIPAAGLGETDGPLGALYLARTLTDLGIRVRLVSDPFCRHALEAGLRKCGHGDVAVLDLPSEPGGLSWSSGEPTHLLAIERVGPSRADGRCYTMRGIDITDRMLDAASLFDRARPPTVTIGIGDGGNEIGMGKVPWDVIRRNIPRGETIACRVATDHLIVAGVSNWAAYALSSGVALKRGFTPPEEWFDLEQERLILESMVEQGPLVDGVSGARTASVDGLEFMEYAAPLKRIAAIVRAWP